MNKNHKAWNDEVSALGLSPVPQGTVDNSSMPVGESSHINHSAHQIVSKKVKVIKSKGSEDRSERSLSE